MSHNQDQNKLQLLAIGNAIVDVLAQVSDEAVDEQVNLGMTRGGMTLIDEQRAEFLTSMLDNPEVISGGSAANTLACFSALGGNAAYIGKVADDELGQSFREGMSSQNTIFATESLAGGPATARCIILISPDAERSMNTYLGACTTLCEDDIDEELVKNAEITYLEGYLFDPEEAKKAFYKAAKIAEEAGRKIALTLSDSFCVHRHRDDFLKFIKNHVDILFANEEELCALYEHGFEAALQKVGEDCALACVTRGKNGSVIWQEGKRTDIKAVPPTCLIDSTGAGDAYAAGFLHGYVNGADMATCGALASRAASEIIAAIGPRPQENFEARVSQEDMKKVAS